MRPQVLLKVSIVLQNLSPADIASEEFLLVDFSD